MSKRLEAEVWSLDTCAGCGLCVAACSKQVLKWDGEAHPVLEKRTKTVGYSKETLDSWSVTRNFVRRLAPGCSNGQRWRLGIFCQQQPMDRFDLARQTM